ncbi:MAG: WD40-like beta Propeller containing protein [Gammaproteobacteria bacterium]|nr:WD40-like beta Propeller containing protein [Gammaproteobacteria bacterium]
MLEGTSMIEDAGHSSRKESAPGFFIRACKGLLLAALVLYTLVQDVIPAVTAVTDDFPTYFTAAKMVREGQDGTKLYDGAWFREQMRRYGLGTPTDAIIFPPYPPPTALLLVPLAGLQPLTALRVLTALNVLCLVCSMLLLSKILNWRLVDSALFILLSGHALHTGLRFGHPYILMSTLCMLGYYLHLKRRPTLAGLCLGVFVPIKYWPVSILAAFGLHRQWRVLLGGGLAIAAVVLVSIGMLGWEAHRIFLADVLFHHLSGHLISSNPLPAHSAQAQSFDMLFARLFILDPLQNPHPLLATGPLPRALALASVKGLLVLAAAMALVKLARGTAASAIAPTIGILGILTILLAPGSGTYAGVLLWLPVALLVEYFRSAGARVQAYLILGLYALIGFLPYGHLNPFEGRGALSVLAYPRLLLLLAMFVVCIHAVIRPARQPVAPLQPGSPVAPLS